MKQKRDKIIFQVTTGFLTAFMLMSAGMYFFNYDTISEIFTSLGFPAYIVYPLAVLKILGLIAIWSNRSKSLKEWAYAGFFFDFVLALSAHINAGDAGLAPPIVALILLFSSYFFDKKINASQVNQQ